ncbi:CvpA family protein [Tundrisphaera sp. TA3]|uniref:CvpA family protein n=1 Tax=Tundrisphaera sp. TA3 TaxID=3435775 RepID=UPI003EBA49B4
MTIYDAAMAGVIILGMVWGAWRGITWQLASIASLVLGYSVSQPLSAQLAPRFPGDPTVSRALAMLTVYVGVSAAVFLVAWVVRATLRRMQFEAFDRHLGMVLGGLEGALLGLVITLFVVSLAPKSRDPIFASPSGKVAGKVMLALGPILPATARDIIDPIFDPDRAEEVRRQNDEVTDAVASGLKVSPELLSIGREIGRASTAHAGNPERARTSERRRAAY